MPVRGAAEGVCESRQPPRVKEADDYVDTARQRLGGDALPQQQQTLTLALLLAVCDLMRLISTVEKELFNGEAKRSSGGGDSVL